MQLAKLRLRRRVHKSKRVKRHLSARQRDRRRPLCLFPLAGQLTLPGRTIQLACERLVAAQSRTPVQHDAGRLRAPRPLEDWTLSERCVDRDPGACRERTSGRILRAARARTPESLSSSAVIITLRQLQMRDDKLRPLQCLKISEKTKSGRSIGELRLHCDQAFWRGHQPAPEGVPGCTESDEARSEAERYLYRKREENPCTIELPPGGSRVPETVSATAKRRSRTYSRHNARLSTSWSEVISHSPHAIPC
jgi:hypothetical protein